MKSKEKREKSWGNRGNHLRFGILADFLYEVQEREKEKTELYSQPDLSDIFTKCITRIEELLEQERKKWKEEMRKAIDEERKKVANISKKIYQGAIREAIDEALWEGMRLFIPIVANKKNTKIINKKYKITRKELYKKFSLKDK